MRRTDDAQATVHATLPSHQTLSQLACDDPQAFEALRNTLINDCIDGAPEKLQHHLRQIQFRVEGIRRLSRSPLGALVKIQAMMWDSFLKMNEELQDFSLSSKAPLLFRERKTEVHTKSAKIMKFRPHEPLTPE